MLEDTGTKRMTYLYDFGDGWEHTIRVEYVVAPEPGARYPQLVEATGRCPPEDIGGPPGYEEYLEAIKDPSHASRRVHRMLRRQFRSRCRRYRGHPTRTRNPGQALVASVPKTQGGLTAVVSGRLRRIDPALHCDYDRALLQVLEDFDLQDLPVLANLDFGHSDPMFTLPYGVRAEIDCSTAELAILETSIS